MLILFEAKKEQLVVLKTWIANIASSSYETSRA